jgi:hypothetical protein
MASSSSSKLDDFLRPLAIDTSLVLQLAKELTSTFSKLSRESSNQFLSTPISEPILRHVARSDNGRYVELIPRYKPPLTNAVFRFLAIDM